jgi:hypothetical protein
VEKERLYDENIQLKQLSNSLIDENQKLKTKLMQKEYDLKRPLEKEFKSSSLVSSLKFQVRELKDRIEKMQVEYNELKVSVRATRVAELEEEAKQYFNECWRLKKIIEEGVPVQSKDASLDVSSDLPEKLRAKASELEALRTENGLIKNKLDKVTKESIGYKKMLDEAQKEIQKNRNELEEVKAQLFKLVEEKKSEKELLDNLEKSLGVEESKENLAPPSFKAFKRAQTKVSDSSSKELDRELGTNPEVIIDRFFKSLDDQIISKNLSTNEFISLLQPDSSGKVDLLKFPGILKENGFRFSNNELKAVYSILSASGQEISIKIIENYLDLVKKDSEKSYDISSEFSIDNYVPNDLAIAKINNVNKEDLAGVFEFLFVLLRHQKFTREKFRGFLISKLPESVNLAHLAKLFFEKTCRIEEGVERNKVCSLVLENKEMVSRDEAIENILKFIYRNYSDEDNQESFLMSLEHLKKNQEKLIERFKEKDEREKGWLSWNVIQEILKETLDDWDEEGILQLKIKSFGIEESLNIVPYANIFDLT